MYDSREQLREEIRAHAPEWLQRDKRGTGYICPLCGSGSGSKGTGITSKDGVHFTCWAGCYTNADIIDIIGQLRGLTDYNDKLQAAAEEILHYSGNVRDLQSGTRGLTDEEINRYFEKQKRAKATPEPEPKTDYTEFFRECAARINETDYHRGLSAETLHRFNVGYCPDWIHPKVIAEREASGDTWRPPTTPRLIVPTTAHSYLARDTRQDIPEDQERYSKPKVGGVHMLNLRALDGTEPVYIEEGEINALSVIDVGAPAVALGSTSMVKHFLEYVEHHKPKTTLILSLDNDRSGKTAQAQLVKGLERLKIPFICYNVSGKYNDPNDFLMADRQAFTAAVKYGIKLVTETPQERYQRQYSAAAKVQGVIDEIAAGIGINAYTPTGFPQLDDLLDGGLFPGLYVMGALSSTGKTTFMLQIADQIAKSGRDVLFFSLEMDHRELMFKSVSRISFLQSVAKGKGKTLAKTTRGIMTSERWAHYRAEEKQHLMAAFEEYGATEQRLNIISGIGNVGVEEIKNQINMHKDIMGTTPVVFIDYLQILKPADMRCTDKQNTDQAVLALKRLSRDYAMPIFAISSFNRDNYTEPVSMSSFKESGAIEYSSDVLIGLQPKGWDYEEGDSKPERKKRLAEITRKNDRKAKSGGAVEIEVKVLKNRNGSKGVVNTAFTPCFNHFAETQPKPEPEEDDNWVDSTKEDDEWAAITAGGSQKVRGID